jgi:hypothetical protein
VTLRFTDGVQIDPSGPLRIERLRDGLYVLGRGWLVPCATREEADEVLADQRGRLEKGGGA